MKRLRISSSTVLFSASSEVKYLQFRLLCLWVLFEGSLYLSAVSMNHFQDDDDVTTGLILTIVTLALLKKINRLGHLIFDYF